MKDTLTFTHHGMTYANFSEADALAAGVPGAVIDAARLADRRTAIKAECRRRIYAVASAEAQMNVTALSATIGAKAASSRTADENAILAGANAAIEWVNAMRAAIDDLAADPNADFLADGGWPLCPQAVLDLYARF